MKKSKARILFLAAGTLAAVALTHQVTQARLDRINQDNALGSSLMDARAWEPAGDLLSDVFAGTDIDWVNDADDTWTLPGSNAERQLVEHKGKKRPNHQQFTAKTKGNWRSFHMQLDFRFQDAEGTETKLEQFGNSGIYIYGLYEVQLVDTSCFLDPGSVPERLIRDGMIRAELDGNQVKTPANKCLCGAIYGGGRHSDTDPLAGAPTDREGKPCNFCKTSGRWNRMDLFFVPPKFQNGRKTHLATIAVFINGRQVYFGGKDRYGIPQPTGSQWQKPDQDSGPIVIQDHGSKVSFREMRVDSSWTPGSDWAVAAGPQENIADTRPANTTVADRS